MTEQHSSSGTAGAHTPTPWVASRQYLYAGDRTLPIASGQHDWATDTGGPSHAEACANAAFIVKAVNAHADLVKALERMQPFLNGDRPTVNEQNIWEHWRSQNALLIDLRQIVDAALSQVSP